MKTLIAITTCLLTLTGCQESEEQRLLTPANAAKKSIAERYKDPDPDPDPDAVLFKDVKLDWQQKHIYGQMNAKSGYGGYTGYESFRAELKGAGIQTTVASMWTIRNRLNQIDDDHAADRITATEAAKARLATIFEAQCDDADNSKKPVDLPTAA